MKIRSVKKFTTRFKKMAFGAEPESEILAVHSQFDENGNVISETRVDEEDQEERHLFAYDAQGKLISHTLEIIGDGITEKFEYTRDDKGRVVREVKYYGDDAGETVNYTYLSHVQPVTIERFDADGEPESFEKITYNEKDLLTELSRFAPGDQLVERTVLVYDDNDLPVEKQVYDATGAVMSQTQYTYNEKKEMVRARELNSSGKVVSDVVTTYDASGNVISKKIRDFHSRTLRYQYDDRNNCTEEETFDEHGNLTMKSNSEFDEHNQLVAESGYYLDMNRGAQMANTQSRYEYEYW